MRGPAPAAAVANDAVEVKKAARESGGGASDQGGAGRLLRTGKLPSWVVKKREKQEKNARFSAISSIFRAKNDDFHPLQF
jgi:hypothetical protein